MDEAVEGAIVGIEAEEITFDGEVVAQACGIRS